MTTASSRLCPDDDKPARSLGARFVARQPILTTEEKVFGYELLFRDGIENFVLAANVGRGSKELDKKTNPARIEGGAAGAFLASAFLAVLVWASVPVSLRANRDIWFGLRWSLGGGVASTRSEGVGEQRTDVLGTALAPPAKLSQHGS